MSHRHIELDPVRAGMVRQAAYRTLLDDTPHDQAEADALRPHSRQNKAFGNERFRARIQALVGGSVEARPRGRPRLSDGKCA